MNRYINTLIRNDLKKKMVILTGPRQVGKTTLSKQLLAEDSQNQYLNFDVLEHRQIIQNQTWVKKTPLLVFDEIHKMRDWKSWLKGVFDGRSEGQEILVIGSARMDTFQVAGESLAGRFYRLRLHPISVKEWVQEQHVTPEEALLHLLERGGFPEPTLADSLTEAQRWRSQYFSGLIREDILEFSRIEEVNAMRMFTELLRSRVGSPLSLASIARDLGVSPMTLKRYLEILEALFIVFTVHPWHHNIARATLKAPKVYFYDTGMVVGDEGIKFENLVACHLLKNIEWQQDALGKNVGLHYIRTKDQAEVDFVMSHETTLTHLVECKLASTKLHTSLIRFANQWPQATAIQLVKDCNTDLDIKNIIVRNAADWLAKLDV